MSHPLRDVTFDRFAHAPQIFVPGREHCHEGNTTARVVLGQELTVLEHLHRQGG
jgi:hypothetical protein